MNLQQRIDAFVKLGDRLRGFISGNNEPILEAAVPQAYVRNGWFVEPFVRTALEGIAANLEHAKLTEWTSKYPDNSKRRKVGVIMAGNIPAAGFFDALCVLISGNDLIAKTSSDDDVLMRAILDLLVKEEPGFAERIRFGDFRSNPPEAVIATGSNNTARYFDYYFAKYPNIIRKNRNSAAVLSGNETATELDGLADDVFLYFGLGCRNVSKVFIPEGYDKDNMFRAFYRYKWVVDNKKYGNNYDYNKTIFLLNNEDVIENGFFIMKKEIGLNSPMATLFVEEYKSVADVLERLRQDSANIQCVVSSIPEISGAVPFGKTQKPGLTDYPDKVDVMKFLSGL